MANETGDSAQYRQRVRRGNFPDLTGDDLREHVCRKQTCNSPMNCISLAVSSSLKGSLGTSTTR
jgi:hypothetical protein